MKHFKRSGFNGEVCVELSKWFGFYWLGPDPVDDDDYDGIPPLTTFRLFRTE